MPARAGREVRMTKLNTGDQAPAFSLKDQSGGGVALSGFKGRKVLVYFYPKADTPGCTRQACSVRDNLAALFARGIVALGISPDPPPAQKRFDLKFNLGFGLLSDPDHRVAEAYGAYGEKISFGKPVEGIIRSAFLIDEQGRIVRAWVPVKPDEMVPAVIASLG
jgi:peroxiredoxin Q/BCP